MKLLANKIFRHLKLYFVLVRLSVMSVIVYRANSLLMGLTPLVWMGTILAFTSIIYGGNKELGGWTYWEMIALLGIHEIIFLDSYFFFIDNLNRFSEEVNQGKFDRILLRPVNHRFLISFNSIDLTAVAGILNSSIMIILSFSHLVINLNLMKIILFLISFLSAHIIIYLIYFLISCLSLFFVNADTYADWLMEATDFDRYPAEIYSDFLRFFLLFALPILFFAYVPVAILLDKLSGYYAGLGLVVIFVLYLISTIVWRLGLKNYQSASS